MCDQCQAVTINGVGCHETGCPNSWKDPATDQPYLKECFVCGCDFSPEDAENTVCRDCWEDACAIEENYLDGENREDV